MRSNQASHLPIPTDLRPRGVLLNDAAIFDQMELIQYPVHPIRSWCSLDWDPQAFIAVSHDSCVLSG